VRTAFFERTTARVMIGSKGGERPRAPALRRGASGHVDPAGRGEAPGRNDACDLITPLSFGGASATFPDKERSSTTLSTLSSASLGLSERSNSRGQQRSKSFKSSSRSNSFNSFRGLTPNFQPQSLALSRQPSDASQPDGGGRPPLKVFVALPGGGGGGGDSPVSSATIEHLSKVADRASAGAFDDVVEDRPPSPRPNDQKTGVQLHSEVLEEWEDAIRFRQLLCLAAPKYKRSDSRPGCYKAEGPQE
jgi:hypothetical protein